MAGAVISAFAEATTSATSQPPAGAPRPAAQADAQRLADLLETDPSRIGEVMAREGRLDPASDVPATSGKSIGDAILRSLDATGKAYKDKSLEIDRILAVDGGKVSTVDLLRIQFQLIEASLQVDLYSKCISKGNQCIDQLTKLQ
jgi:type III secretion system YscI/HrpB-like protein